MLKAPGHEKIVLFTLSFNFLFVFSCQQSRLVLKYAVLVS